MASKVFQISKILFLSAFMAILIVPQANAVFIDFNDGTDRAPIGGFYSGLGVTFSNTEWWDVTPFGGDPPGVSGLKIRSISDAQFPKSTNPLVATFSLPVNDLSIMALDVGENGARIDAYDAPIGGNLVDFDEAVGSDIGWENHVLLVSGGGGIYRLEMYQPYSTNSSDGMIFDNLTFNPVPLPGAVWLLGSGLLGLGAVGWRRRRED